MNMIENWINEAGRRVWLLFKCGLKRVSYINQSAATYFGGFFEQPVLNAQPGLVPAANPVRAKPVKRDM